MTQQETSKLRAETPIDESDNDLCRALWLAVSIQAILDATNRSRKKESIRARADALQWLSENDDLESELSTVCDLAGLSVTELRERFKQVLRNSDDSIDFRCMKKAGVNNRGNEGRKRYFARARKNARLRQERNATQIESSNQDHAISPYCELKKTAQIGAKYA